jgi:hypothetical protein
VDVLQPDLRGVPDLRPRPTRVGTVRQIGPTPRAVLRHRPGPGPVRQPGSSLYVPLAGRVSGLSTAATSNVALDVSPSPASESRDGGVEEFVESVPSLRFSAAFYPRNWALSSKSVVFGLQHRNSRRQRGKSHGHSPQLVIRQTLRPGLTLPKIIPRQRPSHAKHAGKPAGQANPEWTRLIESIPGHFPIKPGMGIPAGKGECNEVRDSTPLAGSR